MLTDDERDRHAVYTQRAVAEYYVGQLNGLLTEPLIVDPSAGDGVFGRYLRRQFPRSVLLEYDITPRAAGIVQQDWFELTLPTDRRIAVVGNPPFGFKHELAAKFLQHAAAQPAVTLIAFFMPKKYQVLSQLAKLLDDSWVLVQFQVPQLESFRHPDGTRAMCPTVWAVVTREERAL